MRIQNILVAENKKEIVEFVKKQLNSKSPRTRKKANEFLKKWGGVNIRPLCVLR